jgi:hypothetical protein
MEPATKEEELEEALSALTADEVYAAIALKRAVRASLVAFHAYSVTARYIGREHSILANAREAAAGQVSTANTKLLTLFRKSAP